MHRRGPAEELRATIDQLPLQVRQGVLDGIKGRRIIAGAHADGSGGVCPMVAADSHVQWRTVSRPNVATAQQAAIAWDRYVEASGISRTATKRQLLALTSMLEASILAEESRTEVPFADVIAEFERSRSRGIATETPAARPYAPAPADYTYAPPAPHAAPAPYAPAAPYAPPVAPAPAAPVAPAPPAPVAAPSAPEAPTHRKRLRDTGERDRSKELHERGGWAWLRPFRSYDEYEETLLRALAELDAADPRRVELLR